MNISRFVHADNWPLWSALSSAFMLAAAHGFERFLYLAPCPLCYTQRQVYWVVLGVSLLILVLKRLMNEQTNFKHGNFLLGAIFTVGAFVAFYHTGVEFGIFAAPESCATNGVLGDRDLLSGLEGRHAIPSCAEVTWSFLGLSMATWNGVVSSALALLSFAYARPLRRLFGSGHLAAL